jgi:hypothetical protein
MADYGVQFNDSGVATAPSWASGSGVFSVRVEFTTPSVLGTDGLIGTADASTASNYIAPFSSGNYVVRMAGVTQYNSSTGLISASTRYTILVERLSGTDVDIYLLDSSGATLDSTTVSTSAAFTFTQIGRVGQSALPFSGIIWKVLVTGGTQSRTYQSTTNAGNNWTDTVSSQDATLVGLAGAPSQWVLESGSDGITINTLASLLQRNGSGNIVFSVSGTYSGSPTSIRRKVIYDDDSSTVTGFDWATYVATPSGNSYTGANITLPASSRKYRVLVDWSNDAGVTATSNTTQSKDNILIFGQSLGLQMSDIGSSVTPNALVRYADKVTGVLTTPAAGDGSVTMGNAIASFSGQPVVIINPSFSTMSLLEENESSAGNYLWDSTFPNTTRYQEYLVSINAVGGDATAALYLQGEQDAKEGNLLGTYQARLETVFAQIRSDTRADLPIIICALGKADVSYQPTDASWEEVRQAQIAVVANDVNTYLVAKQDVQPLADVVHLTAAGYATVGARAGNVIITNALGGSVDWESPVIASFAVVSTTQTRVNITHGQGTDFTPTTGITGFELTTSGNAYTVNITSAARETATAVLLTHDAAAVTAGRWDYGKAPVITGVVLDNSTLNLPLVPVTLNALAGSSTLNITATGTPDGTYKTIITNPNDDSIVFAGNLAYSSGVATTGSLSLAVSTALTGFVIDSEATHVNGAVITGTTV